MTKHSGMWELLLANLSRFFADHESGIAIPISQDVYFTMFGMWLHSRMFWCEKHDKCQCIHSFGKCRYLILIKNFLRTICHWRKDSFTCLLKTWAPSMPGSYTLGNSVVCAHMNTCCNAWVSHPLYGSRHTRHWMAWYLTINLNIHYLMEDVYSARVQTTSLQACFVHMLFEAYNLYRRLDHQTRYYLVYEVNW